MKKGPFDFAGWRDVKRPECPTQVCRICSSDLDERIDEVSWV